MQRLTVANLTKIDMDLALEPWADLEVIKPGDQAEVECLDSGELSVALVDEI